jgi:hypothetical protein
MEIDERRGILVSTIALTFGNPLMRSSIINKKSSAAAELFLNEQLINPKFMSAFST